MTARGMADGDDGYYDPRAGVGAVRFQEPGERMGHYEGDPYDDQGWDPYDNLNGGLGKGHQQQQRLSLAQRQARARRQRRRESLMAEETLRDRAMQGMGRL
ncbi:MAG: hypothetical protein Q9207_008595, partial [Kuettlingeria erythrocarpa]